MMTSLRQFFTFCLVGVSNGLVDIVVYTVLTRVLFPWMWFILPAKALSYLVATGWSFFVNRTVTFHRTTRVTVAEFVKFYSTVGLGIFLNVGTQYIAVYVWGLNDLLGVVIAAGATAVWGFLFSKFYVFKK